MLRVEKIEKMIGVTELLLRGLVEHGEEALVLVVVWKCSVHYDDA